MSEDPGTVKSYYYNNMLLLCAAVHCVMHTTVHVRPHMHMWLYRRPTNTTMTTTRTSRKRQWVLTRVVWSQIREKRDYLLFFFPFKYARLETYDTGCVMYYHRRRGLRYGLFILFILYIYNTCI